jgi:hypothetical protein
VHALSDKGKVPVKVTAPGYGDTSFAVQLEPLAFEFVSNTIPPIQATLEAGSQSVQVSPATPTGPGSYAPTPVTLRPGVQVAIGVTSSNSSIVSVSSKPILFQGTANAQTVGFTPVKTGLATLSLKVRPATRQCQAFLSSQSTCHKLR